MTKNGPKVMKRNWLKNAAAKRKKVSSNGKNPFFVKVPELKTGSWNGWEKPRKKPRFKNWLLKMQKKIPGTFLYMLKKVASPYHPAEKAKKCLAPSCTSKNSLQAPATTLPPPAHAKKCLVPSCTCKKMVASPPAQNVPKVTNVLLSTSKTFFYRRNIWK